jgi:hypothetical protein
LNNGLSPEKGLDLIPTKGVKVIMLNPIKALQRRKFFADCALVQQSETRWCSQTVDQIRIFYRGGISGRYVAINRLGHVSFGSYDGALPTMKDAVYQQVGFEAYTTEELAIQGVIQAMGEAFVKDLGRSA